MMTMSVDRVISVVLIIVVGVMLGRGITTTCEREALVESSVVDVVEARSNAPHTETHEGKPVKSIRTPSLEPEAAFTTVSGMCSETKDLFPGRTETSANGTMRWMPEKCKLPTVAELEGRKCMAGKNQVWFGDSNLYRLAMAMGRRAGKGTEESVQKIFFDPKERGNFPKNAYNYYLEMIDPTSGKYPAKQSFNNGRMYFTWSPAARRPAAFEYDMTQAAIPSADYVVINSGMWDMGGLYTPITEYFHTMRKRVEMVKKMMKPGARLLLIPVHYLNIHKCPRGKKCERCNSPQKAYAYRAAFSLVASCTGAALLRSIDIMKEAENYTIDGVHYTDEVMGMQADIISSYMCGGMKLPSDPSMCRTTGDIEKTLRKLVAIPEANMRCREG